MAEHDRAGSDRGEVTEELTVGDGAGPWLVEIGGVGGGVQRVLHAGERVVLGSGDAADWRVPDAAVSARHAALEASARGVDLCDLGSRNGTFLGGARVGRARIGAGGAVFVVGRTAVGVSQSGGEEPTGDGAAAEELLGTSRAMRRLRDLVVRVAPVRAPVLLVGESGTGKDLVARALHRLGRPSGPFVPLNMGGIAEGLADSELFGHHRGAFTGAVAQRAGAFECAHRGTLFLDEIADLSPALQVRLLRVVEDGMVRAVGAQRALQVDVRVVSACWADLEERVVQGRFRADLLHRLATIVIRVPPLRERRSDLPALVAHWLARHESEIGRRRVTSAALSRLAAHAWPGNVRELGAVLYRAALETPGATLDVGAVEAALRPRLPAGAKAEPRDVQAVLAAHGNNVSRAARALGVPRSTFRTWLARARAPTAAPQGGGARWGR